MQESTVSLLVLVAALIVTIISLPDVPGVHSLSDDSSRTRHGRKYKQLSDEEEFDGNIDHHVANLTELISSF